MITYGNISFSSSQTKTGRALAYVDIIYSGNTYNWMIYISLSSGQTLEQYLNENASIYEADIKRKEEYWLTCPKTKIIQTPNGPLEVSVLKEEIVKPTIPDYLETIADSALDIQAIKRLLIQLTENILTNTGITHQEIKDLSTIYTYYEVGKSYAINDVFSFEGKLYKVIQSHTSQADWLPPNLRSLYSPYTPQGSILEWVQPYGSADAYSIDDKVTYNGYTWQSTINYNVWTPGAYGWTNIDIPQQTTTTTTSSSTNWSSEVYYSLNQIVTYNSLSYKCIQSHTSQTGWEPPNAPSLWQLI